MVFVSIPPFPCSPAPQFHLHALSDVIFVWIRNEERRRNDDTLNWHKAICCAAGITDDAHLSMFAGEYVWALVCVRKSGWLYLCIYVLYASNEHHHLCKKHWINYFRLSIRFESCGQKKHNINDHKWFSKGAALLGARCSFVLVSNDKSVDGWCLLLVESPHTLDCRSLNWLMATLTSTVLAEWKAATYL